MPFIINSHGKAVRRDPLTKLFMDAATANLSKLYEELQIVNSLNKATGEALDRLVEVYGIERKDAVPGTFRT
jgi:hypothetical protein